MHNETTKAVDSEIACAKINLALHVRKRLPDGYHDIETIFAFLDRGDILTVEPSGNISLSIEGDFADSLSNSDNLILDAATLLKSHSGTSSGGHIILQKYLPVASGIGGGSADAAAALRLLNRYWNIGLPMEELAALSAPLGADVPACVINQTCRGEGIGHKLMPIGNSSLADHFCLLVNPLIPVSTASVFQAWDGVDRGPLQGNTILEIAQDGRNDLQDPAESLAPIIGAILTKLDQTEAVLTRMSGSGATCFGLYRNKDQAETAKTMIDGTFANVWTMIGGLS